MGTFISHGHPPTLHLLQQQQQQAQQTQAQQPSMIPPTHQQNTPTLYQSYYQPQFGNMPQFVNATPQQMSMGMMGTPMMPPQTQQQLTGNGPNTNMTNNPNTGGMPTPNAGAGQAYKPNNNPAHSGDTGNNSVNNVAPKKGKLSLITLLKRYAWNCCSGGIGSTCRTIECTSTATSIGCSINGLSRCTHSILST